MLQRAGDKHLKFKLKKVQLRKDKVKYMGMIISRDGIQTWQSQSNYRIAITKGQIRDEKIFGDGKFPLPINPKFVINYKSSTSIA